MSRALYLSLDEGVVVLRCLSEHVGISTIEGLPGGGVRLVCNSSGGAAIIRCKLKSYVMDDDTVRERHRPSTPTW